MMDSKIVQKANQMLKKAPTVHLGVVDESGYPVVMAMSIINPESISEIYLSTNLDSNKSKSLQKNNKASVCYSTNENNITLVGEAEILTDQETKSKCWQNWFIEIYQGGETDPNYCIIKFTTKRASLFIDHDASEFEITK